MQRQGAAAMARSNYRSNEKTQQLVVLAILLLFTLGVLGFLAFQPTAPVKRAPTGLAAAGSTSGGAGQRRPDRDPHPAPDAVGLGRGAAGSEPPPDTSGAAAGAPDAGIAQDLPAAREPDAGTGPHQPEGRCQKPKFRKLVAILVNTCAVACKDDTSPLVPLTEEQFEALFAQDDDAGVATHFAIFGCTRYTAGRKGCVGYNSYYADPVKVDEDLAANTLNGKQADNARESSTVIKRAFVKWLLRNSQVRYLVLLGNASTAGNKNGQMSSDNKRLALNRANRVRALAEGTRTDAMARMESFPVVLNNAVRNFNRPRFRDMVTSRLPTSDVGERGFTPTGTLAINRSVMALAISCNLDQELRDLKGE